MLPHLKDRPLTLQRYPNGIDGETFFEKQMPRGMPEWVERVTVPTPEDRAARLPFRSATTSRASSISRISRRSCCTCGPRASQRSTNPTSLLFDLDPGEKCTLKTLATVTLAIRELLAEIGLKPLVKTTGGFGLHVVVPLAAGYSYETAKIFAEIVARHAAARAGRARDAAAHDRQAPAKRGLHRLRAGRSRKDDRGALLGARPRRGAGLDAAALGRGRGLCPAALGDRAGRRVCQAHDPHDARRGWRAKGTCGGRKAGRSSGSRGPAPRPSDFGGIGGSKRPGAVG